MNIWDYFLDLLYPPRCMLCRKILRYMEKDFCTSCRQSLPKYMADGPRRDLKNVEICVAPFVYKEEIRSSLIRYKFHSVTAYASVYADFIAKSIDENGISCDIITWVPLSRRRLRRRGYDQAGLIAHELADKFGVPCEKLLTKVKENKRQSSIKNPEKRKVNVRGVYSYTSAFDVADKRVLLVDDIVTTGSTLSECASEIKKHGCSSVCAVAAASR